MFFLSLFSDKAALKWKLYDAHGEGIPLIGVVDQVKKDTGDDHGDIGKVIENLILKKSPQKSEVLRGDIKILFLWPLFSTKVSQKAIT